MATTGHTRHPAPPHLWQMFRFSPCDCGPRDFVRLRRPAWARMLFPRKRMYQCPHCGSTVLYGR
jgi:hypothetical protein